MAISTYAANKLIDHLHGKTSYTMPTVYIALFTANPTIAGGGTECTGGSYARQATSFAAAASRTAATNAAINFTGMPACTITGWALFDASSGGNMLEFHIIEQTVTAEAVTLAAGIGTTANANISSWVVKNNTDSTTYTEGTDYYIQPESGTIIRIASGAITAAQALHITYNYAITRAITAGDTWQFGSGNISSTYDGWL